MALSKAENCWLISLEYRLRMCVKASVFKVLIRDRNQPRCKNRRAHSSTPLLSRRGPDVHTDLNHINPYGMTAKRIFPHQNVRCHTTMTNTVGK